MPARWQELPRCLVTDDDTQALTVSLDRSVSTPIWARNSRSVYIQYDESGSGSIARVDRGGRIRVLATDLGGTAMNRPYSGGSFHLGGNTIAYTRSATQRPTIESGSPSEMKISGGIWYC